ncbi:MAG: TonB-dependent receptor [Bacteroidales bacterium]|nr:TonB-dependent receptor [Bacteroidales bacterium]
MKKILLLSFLVLQVFFAISQTAGIKGFVYEKETGEPGIFINVYLEGTTIGGSTDVNGYYVVNKVPAGNYTLVVSAIGYDTIREKIFLQPNDLISKTFYVEEASIKLRTVHVSAERQSLRTDTKISVTKVTPKQIEQIPSVGGQADLAQYLQVLPGVVFTGDQGGQLYIRGGSPIQNKVLLDGMVIYNPFHSIGLFSVFETDILRNADIYTGGFGAEYGGRISSIMDITTRDGNKKRISGKIAASTFGAGILLEGPFVKQTENGGGSSSFIFSAKTSYLDQTSNNIYSYVDEEGLPFSYTDLYGKASLNWGSGSKVNFFGFSFNDNVKNYKSLADFSWKNFGGGANILIIPSNSSVLIEGHTSYSNYKIQLIEDQSPARKSSINDFNMGVNFTYFMGTNELKYGLDILAFTTDYSFVNDAGRVVGDLQNTTEFGAFVKYKWMTGNWIIEPSFRLQLYPSLSTVSPEPRLAMKYKATDRLRFKVAAGMYTQNLISATSDRDVVNLFYGFLSGPESVPESFEGKDITDKLQKAQHAIVGLEFDLSNTLTINVEAYYKNFSQLTNLNKNKIYNSNTEGVPDELKLDFIIEKGHAKGLDFSLKYDYDRLFVWAVYSLGYVERTDPNMTYNPHFDRRHNINFLSSMKLGKAYNWEVSIRYNFGSGFPYTPLGGNYEQIGFEGGINEDYTITNGDMSFLYGDYNSKRLPNYHRIDASIKRTFEIGDYSTLEANFSITNVLNRENIFYVNIYNHEIVNQLPIMPSFGVIYRF